MIETIKLRNKPELKIILNSDKFEIVDDSQPNNNGIYLLKEVNSLKLTKKRTDWIVSVFSFIMSIFINSAVGGNFKNQAKLKLELINQNLDSWLNNADFKKLKESLNL